MPRGTPYRAVAGMLLAASSILAVGAAAPPGRAGAETAATPSYFGTPLPAGWELCVLSGVGAKVTSADVADLDLWQVAEGGSTENANRYNPFNTRRDTDGAGNVLPADITSQDFPAFDNWPAGCAATVATILQPNMAPIAAALVSSSAGSPAGFLSLVDTTPWCSPDDGVPCYTTLIALGIDPAPSPAVPLVSGTASTIGSYGQDVNLVAGLEETLSLEQQALGAAAAAVTSAQQGVQEAFAQLRTLAIYDYTSDNALDNDLNLKQFEVPDESEQIKQYYETVDDTDQVALCAQAEKLLAQDQAHRTQVAAAISETNSALGAAQGSVVHVVDELDGDVASLQSAGTCAGVRSAGGNSAAAAAMVSALSSCVAAL